MKRQDILHSPLDKMDYTSKASFKLLLNKQHLIQFFSSAAKNKTQHGEERSMTNGETQNQTGSGCPIQVPQGRFYNILKWND